MKTQYPELIGRIRAGKDALREARRTAPLEEKLRQLVKAQHLYVQVVGSRRGLEEWQRPWNVLNVVSKSCVIGPTGVEPKKPSVASATRSNWALQ